MFWKHLHCPSKTILTASAGNRTQVNCLEGSYAHHDTTKAWAAFIWYVQTFATGQGHTGNKGKCKTVPGLETIHDFSIGYQFPNVHEAWTIKSLMVPQEDKKQQVDFMLFTCIGRESNPGHLLGKQRCYPLYHQRMWKHIATCMEDYLQFKPCKQSGLLLASVHWWALTLMKVKSSFSATCQSLYVCEGGTQIWTRDLLICSQMLYHWAIPPHKLWLHSITCSLSINNLGFNEV